MSFTDKLARLPPDHIITHTELASLLNVRLSESYDDPLKHPASHKEFMYLKWKAQAYDRGYSKKWADDTYRSVYGEPYTK